MREATEGNVFFYQVTKSCNMYRASGLDSASFWSLQARIDEEGNSVCPLYGKTVVVRSSELYPERDIQEYVYGERKRLFPGLEETCNACLAPTLVPSFNFASSLVISRVLQEDFELAPEMDSLQEDLG